MARSRVVMAVAACVLASAACRDGGAAGGARPAPPASGAEGAAATGVPPDAAPASTALPAPAPPPVEPWPGPPPPASAAEAAAVLARVERALRDPATPVAALAALAVEQQVAYRAVAANPTWRPTVEAAVPAELLAAVRANIDAEVALRTRLVKPRRSLPSWRIVAPPPADELVGHYRAAAAATGVDWEVLAAIHLVETRMGRIRGTSTAGARGPMQFIPQTWARFGQGGDIEDHRDAIAAAGRLLATHGYRRDQRRAVWHYNPSWAYVDAVLAYTAVLRADERAYRGYHGWQVFYRLTTGDVVLPEGWDGSA